MASRSETSGSTALSLRASSSPALGQVSRATLPLYTIRRLRPRPAGSRGRARSENRLGSQRGGGRPGAPQGFAGWGRPSVLRPLLAWSGKQELSGAKGREAALAFLLPLSDHLECSHHVSSLAAAIILTVVTATPPVVIIIKV